MESTQCKDIDVIRMILLVVGVIMNITSIINQIGVEKN